MFARFAQLASLALTLVFGSQANAAPLTYGTYYEDTIAALTCNSSCRVLFSQTPADKLLMVSRITCSINSSNQPGAFQLQISTTQGGNPFSRAYDLAPTPRLLSTGVWQTQVNEQVHFLIGQGRFPNLRIDNITNVFTLYCILVGDLVTPIQ
jgi:hypothetical protein